MNETKLASYVRAWNRDTHTVFSFTNRIIRSIEVPKAKHRDILLTTQDLMLDSPTALARGLPEKIEQALSEVPTVQSVKMLAVGASSGGRQLLITPAEGFELG